ncbi:MULTISPECIES: cutinase family protein [unclassified Rhodococcus (in: high G+C Gram-positive bacteria)]|uniref:cutinase family protein n=1 Tax=unclassified Rhodococcus (in: high G+C Gram-positive bacteria) TaxID=192944 RepID=UPI000B9A8603|nr:MULTISPECIES: cutinase family protein [unclassified Rhodococcus (in: high G+C Gram-positive bacteria)]OZE38415.1 cutinase [Rhodococcus sp. 05-2254-4]OZE47121.1 cutinase [Rhodococcus sp. 05-2254-3]OZE54885.1 cutinase [Rhodococcus sp. 05-2254-2]
MLRRKRALTSSFGPLLIRSAVVTLALALAAPAAALAAPDSGSAESGSAESGSSDSGSADAGSSDFGSSQGPNIDPNNYAQDCPDVLVLAVSGATDSASDRNPLAEQASTVASNWVGNVTVPVGEANADSPGTVGWLYVPYASTYGFDVLDDVPTYHESIVEGVATTNRLMDEYKVKCGDRTKFVLLGYSVGGEVLDRLSTEIGARDSSALVNGDDIAGVIMVGSPYRPAGVPNFGDEPGESLGGFMDQSPRDYGTLTDKVTWSCRPWDLACDAPDDIELLQLALEVISQMRLTVLNPVQTVSDFARAVTTIASRAIVDIATDKSWFTSDETLLQVLVRVADVDYTVADQQAVDALTPEQLLADLNWAMGPGAETVEAKLRAEATGFEENNKGIADVVLGPYLALGFLQHLSYWYNDPNDGYEWESEKMVAWITDLARTEREKKNAPQTAAPEAPAPEIAPEPRLLPEPGTVTQVSDLGAFLESQGIPVPEGMFPPQYSTVPDPAASVPVPN